MTLFGDYVNEKIKEMEDSGSIQKRIEENIERSVYNAIDEVFGNSWSDFNSGLKEKMKNEVPTILNQIDISCANEFILTKAKNYINCLYDKEVSEKIVKNLEKLFVKNYQGITISDIYDKFIEMIKDMSNDILDRDKLNIDDENYCSFIFEINHCGPAFSGSSFEEYSVTIRLNEDEEYISFAFSVWTLDCLEKKRNIATIHSLVINGERIDEKFNMSLFNDFELMLINIYLSKTEVDFKNLNDEIFENEIELDYIDED